MTGATDPGPVFTREDLGVTGFWRDAAPERQDRQRAWQEELRTRGDVTLGTDVFVSELAAVYADRLVLGDRCYLSGYTAVWGDVATGADCTLNSHAELRGRVRLGDGVRIGPHSSILGYNHGMDPDRPVKDQDLVTAGIEIGDDVWIGAHVAVLDGVTVGDHSVLAAGAIVTKDVAPWAIVAGNPARPIGDRRHRGRRRTDGWLDRAVRLVEQAAHELPTILERAVERGGGAFIDHAGAAPTVRAQCDAVELAAALEAWDALPVPRDELAAGLRGRQRSETGLVPAWGADTAAWSGDGHADVPYHVLCVGYALQLLGTGFAHPIRTPELAADRLVEELDRLPWRESAWRAGSWVDAAATAMFWNRERFGQTTALPLLFGWLTTRADRSTGLWGPAAADGDLVQPVNGFYRITRGTYAQFGLPVPYPERTIDTVLAHAADGRHFGRDRGTACNVLDVIHPLWLCAARSGHRRSDARDWALTQVERITGAWHPEAGLGFALEPGPGWQRQPGLLGTEMWLSILWLICDHLGRSDALPLRPRGIHRPEPAARFEAVG